MRPAMVHVMTMMPNDVTEKRPGSTSATRSQVKSSSATATTSKSVNVRWSPCERGVAGEYNRRTAAPKIQLSTPTSASATYGCVGSDVDAPLSANQDATTNTTMSKARFTFAGQPGVSLSKLLCTAWVLGGRP